MQMKISEEMESYSRQTLEFISTFWGVKIYLVYLINGLITSIKTWILIVLRRYSTIPIPIHINFLVSFLHNVIHDFCYATESFE